MSKYDFVSVFIVPTGIGASIGGFAGDSSCFVNLISKICPVITNPNTVNAAVFSGINKNILYTEGFAIDSFFKGEVALRPSRFNKIGVIFDKSIPESVMNVHINTLNALKTVYGINISGYSITKREVGIDFFVNEFGLSTGRVNSPDTLIDSGFNLLKKGAEALAVVCYFGEYEENEYNYSKGKGVDPVGGVEAVVSHILTRELRVPVAHAPAFSEKELVIPSKIVNHKAAAEYITPTFLPCIVLGLYNAPKIIKIDKSTFTDITLNSVKSLIVPYNCMGSIPVLKSIENSTTILAIKDNETVLDIDKDSLGLKRNIIEVKNYFEATGYLMALKEGIVTRLSSIQELC